jgi:hypothetical protein
MFAFCPHCGMTLEQEQAEGQSLVCRYCREQIGSVRSAPPVVVVDEADRLIQNRSAARCPVCQQLVEVRGSGQVLTIARHFAGTTPRKLCAGGGKPIPAPAEAAAPNRIPRDMIKVVACKKDADPTIEELTLEYLDKADRVRLQIDALRKILGKSFSMRDYPPELNQPVLAVWGNTEACVAAKKHELGGIQNMTDAEIAQVVADLRHCRKLFCL